MVANASGKKGFRSFEIAQAVKSDGCETKFNKKTRLVGRTPSGAARKAFNGLCRVKRVKGQCTLFVQVRETTKGSAGKVYTYRCKRTLLSKPLVMMKGKDNEFKIEYTTNCKAAKSMPKCKKGSSKSSGRMKRRTSKKQN